MRHRQCDWCKQCCCVVYTGPQFVVIFWLLNFGLHGENKISKLKYPQACSKVNLLLYVDAAVMLTVILSVDLSVLGIGIGDRFCSLFPFS